MSYNSFRFSIVLVILLLLGLLTHGCESQPTDSQNDVDSTLVSDFRTDWLSSNAISIRSVDPADMDYSDLQPLKTAIGNSRVVMLGEQSHGDATTFLAKTRLIKFLHREMGFDVLVFESGLYDCRNSWNYLQTNMATPLAMRGAVFAVWGMSDEFLPLIDYIGENSKTSHPLEIAGMDCQFSSSSSVVTLSRDLSGFLHYIKSPAAYEPDWPPFKSKLDSIVAGRFNNIRVSASDQSAFFSKLDEISSDIGAFAELNPYSEILFWAQLIKSIRAEAQQQFCYNPQDQKSAWLIRDPQMADNLLWLMRNLYRNRKLIVWAATAHIIRNADRILSETGNPLYRDLIPTGHVVWQELRQSLYTVGFTAYEGFAGQINAQPVELSRPGKETLENLLRCAGLNNAFVDFKNLPPGGQWLRQNLCSRPLGYMPVLASWPDILDAIVFTRVMSPSTLAKR